jgi:hypothetical protein
LSFLFCMIEGLASLRGDELSILYTIEELASVEFPAIPAISRCSVWSGKLLLAKGERFCSIWSRKQKDLLALGISTRFSFPGKQMIVAITVYRSNTHYWIGNTGSLSFFRPFCCRSASEYIIDSPYLLICSRLPVRNLFPFFCLFVSNVSAFVSVFCCKHEMLCLLKLHYATNILGLLYLRAWRRMDIIPTRFVDDYTHNIHFVKGLIGWVCMLSYKKQYRSASYTHAVQICL